MGLRLRNRFQRTPWPADLRAALATELAARFGDHPVAVRSSAPAEDAAATSFAGLHESVLDVRGAAAILDQLTRVWASLWSDRALLYRRELSLDPTRSAMAVVVQVLVAGVRSGVAFTRSPVAADEAVIEAVWGLNQGLVDGAIAPDRWHLDRASGAVRRHEPAERQEQVLGTEDGVRTVPLPAERRTAPPLAADEVGAVYDAARAVEARAGAPQDVEWTLDDDARLWLLQARPITTGRDADSQAEDRRGWYLSLHRSLAELHRLRESIEGDSLPAMAAEAARLAAEDLTALDDADLAAAVRRREARRAHWVEVYWRDFIPFAHGMRLFGQVYNDRLRPRDPFEFVDLLRAEAGLLGSQRNHELEALAEQLRADPDLAAATDSGDLPAGPAREALDAYLARFGAGARQERAQLLRLLAEMARAPAPDRPGGPSAVAMAERFLAHFEGQERARMAELLDLGRASYRLRDDDNLILGRVEARLREAVELARDRLGDRAPAAHAPAAELIQLLEDPALAPADSSAESRPASTAELTLRARQLVGQPAGPGLAAGRARVIESEAELFEFQAGEVLVCDALDPTMTLVAPLAVAIVERRGGMLIHGAIIAREYGLPCVTGVPEVTRWVRTGDTLSVDGSVGLVVITAREAHPAGGSG